MEILSIKRPNNGNPTTGLKIYATVKGDSGTEYKIGYFRRASFRGWMCSCPNFVLSQFGKGGHCKHINLIQLTYGRYGAAVEPSKQRKTVQAVVATPVVPTTVVGQIGEKVYVSPEVNSYWTGNGVIEWIGETYITIKMTTGRMVNESGGFSLSDLAPATVPDADLQAAYEAGLAAPAGDFVG